MSAEKARAKRLWDNYGLTVEEWETILEFQRGVCFICGKKQKSGKRLATDHRHSDGLARGLLCSQCNRLLGRIEATFGINIIELLSRVVEYLLGPPAVAALGRQVFGYAGRTGTKKHRKFLKRLKVRKEKKLKAVTPVIPLVAGKKAR